MAIKFLSLLSSEALRESSLRNQNEPLGVLLNDFNGISDSSLKKVLKSKQVFCSEPSEAIRSSDWMLDKTIEVFCSEPSEAIRSSDWMLDRKPAGGF